MSDQTSPGPYGQVPPRPPQPGGPPPDALFGSLQNLATGIFYAAVLLAVSVWLGKQKTTD
ncbi:MAG TPA: hypothetical protein VFH30_01205 [Acidimicrobiales bacterium]|nr:hypothetical protein [Acidimicrobiales bacterium]